VKREREIVDIYTRIHTHTYIMCDERKNRILEIVIDLLSEHMSDVKEIGLLLGDAKVSPDYVLEDGNLGLPLWWGTSVIRSVQMELRDHKHTTTSRRKMELTRAAVIFAPDNYVFWNIRRKELLKKNSKLREEEMRFLDTLSILHPKKEGVWIQRYWVLHLQLQPCDDDDDDLLEPIIRREMNLCTRAATLYRRNYYAWTHRLRVTKIANSRLSLMKIQEFVKDELKSLTAFVKRHISDYSAWNHRLQVLTLTPTQSLILLERDLLDVLMKEYPTHESMWYHRRNIFHLYKTSASTTQELLKHYHTNEIKFCATIKNLITLTYHHEREDYLLFLKGTLST
jgi:hypothetical protein